MFRLRLRDINAAADISRLSDCPVTIEHTMSVHWYVLLLLLVLFGTDSVRHELGGVSAMVYACVR